MLKRQNSNYLLNVSSNILRDYAYNHGNAIYDFMNKYDIGHSAYGSFMDAAAHGKEVIAHRLYGHHLIYDLPVDNLQNTSQFLEHEFSDLFTKQGLPILPGDILKNNGLIKYCDSLTKSWNFVNGFDILAGTVAIYSGIKNFKQYIVDGKPVDSFTDLAKNIGVGSMELAVAISSANPFLLVGGVLTLTSSIWSIFNKGAYVYFDDFRKYNNKFSVQFLNDSFDTKKLNYLCSVEYRNKLCSVKSTNDKCDVKTVNSL